MAKHVRRDFRIPTRKSDALKAYPRPGRLYEDAQGLEPFTEENRGANMFSFEKENKFAQIAAVDPPEVPLKLPHTAQDTLFTYTRRVYRTQLKSLVNTYRHMEEVRIARQHEIAVQKANEIKARKKLYQDWRHLKKMNTMYDHTLRLQKRASEIIAAHHRGDKARDEFNAKVTRNRADFLEMLIEEKKRHWVDPKNVDPSIFSEISPLPTGWWPRDEQISMFKHQFQTDDEDLDDYFTTKYPPYSRIGPVDEAWDDYYADSRSKPGFDSEEEKFDVETKYIRYSDPERGMLDNDDGRGDSDDGKVVIPPEPDMSIQIQARSKVFIDGTKADYANRGINLNETAAEDPLRKIAEMRQSRKSINPFQHRNEKM